MHFESFDEQIATAMLQNNYSGNQTGGGLPAYLGITTNSVGPGRLTCELTVTDELLNPFGAAHGGVVSALIDHALGAVCFPVIPRGSWPATQEFKLNFTAPARPGSGAPRLEFESIPKISLSLVLAVPCPGTISRARAHFLLLLQ